jgi:hypothetical protein
VTAVPSTSGPTADVAADGVFDPLSALDVLLGEVGLSAADAGGTVSFAGQDPIVAARHRLGACIGIPLMAAAVAAVALHRRRGGPAQDLHLDLRQAVHGITPHAFWHHTLAGEMPPHPLVFDNPFLLDPYITRDGRTVMASGVYPHLGAQWLRFLDVPPSPLGAVHTLAPPVRFSHTAPAWPDPVLVPRGSSLPQWRLRRQNPRGTP